MAFCVSSIVWFFFFFQAEDGIRDHCVTGVQTCALPICSAANGHILLRVRPTIADDRYHYAAERPDAEQDVAVRRRTVHVRSACAVGQLRSEERRVGIERSCGRARRRASESERFTRPL